MCSKAIEVSCRLIALFTDDSCKDSEASTVGPLYVVRAMGSVFPCEWIFKTSWQKPRPYIQDVTTGDLGIRRVTLEYHLSYSNLSNCINGRIFSGAGPPKCLCEEEEELVKCYECV